MIMQSHLDLDNLFDQWMYDDVTNPWYDCKCTLHQSLQRVRNILSFKFSIIQYILHAKFICGKFNIVRTLCMSILMLMSNPS